MPDFGDWASRAIATTQQTLDQAVQSSQEAVQDVAETFSRNVAEAVAWITGETIAQPPDIRPDRCGLGE